MYHVNPPDIISTHAPRTGSDGNVTDFDLDIPISTHAPRTGSDEVTRAERSFPHEFQPTLPARGATAAVLSGCRSLRNFNPRSPHGERLRSEKLGEHNRQFQPTLPARGATATEMLYQARGEFQPTLPARGATPLQNGLDSVPVHFNPRSPHGERRSASRISGNGTGFQPTLPARGATAIFAIRQSAKKLFQPTLPARGATICNRCKVCKARISTHAPRTGSDRVAPPDSHLRRVISTHAPRTGSDAHRYSRSPSISPQFQPTLPARGATACAFINKE